MSDRVGVLWSGGLDSTLLTCLLTESGLEVQPYHVLIRGGGGKDARESHALERLYGPLGDRYSNIAPLVTVRQRISPSDDRNLKLVRLVRDAFAEETVAVGVYGEREDLPADTSREMLTRKAGIRVLSFEDYGHRKKMDLVGFARDQDLGELLKDTWSCQLWFKRPCERCYSCKERAAFLGALSL